jgi:hypothetical protein
MTEQPPGSHPPPPSEGYPPPQGSYPPSGSYPPPPPPQYGAPTPATGTNPLAIASLVVSVISLFSWLCTGLLAIVGIVLGVIAMNQIKQSGQGGHGLALAGIIIGAVSILLGVFWTLNYFAWR